MTQDDFFDSVTRPGGNVVSTDTRLPEKIRNLNLGPMIWKITNPETEGSIEVDWNEDQAIKVSEEYRKFLALSLAQEGRITTPCRNVDVIWHHHILDTEKYYEDMTNIFGRIVHHFPYLGVRGSEDRQILLNAYDDTLVRYKEAFGKVPEDVWGEAAHCGVSFCSRPRCRVM